MINSIFIKRSGGKTAIIVKMQLKKPAWGGKGMCELTYSKNPVL